ncbi:hypothetical protein LSH36_152g01041 [Paralvinella palmiformis]|uniref:Sulfotransferase n=1 Tax=Paralvinella palmiformis TaxID=53620 RepID=A0AAD9N8M5_9ANNE|nr:hypothetical protein LSH36_152g01041 [Paralvinella palmiformis]
MNQRIVDTRRSNLKSTEDTLMDEPELIDKNIYKGLDDRIDRMEAEPLPILTNYRTPCWYENLSTPDPYPLSTHLYMRFFRRNIKVRGFYQNTFQKSITIYTRRLKNGLRRWRLRCLPFFYLIGINRGGSTALWTSLASHPQLMSSKAGKEHHYWNEIRYAGYLQMVGYGRYKNLIENDTVPRPIKSYLDIFDSAAEQIAINYVFNEDGERFHPIGLGNYDYNHLISEYLVYQGYHPKTAEQFHELSSEAVFQMKTCLRNRTLRSCAYDGSLALKTEPVVLQHSLYYPFIKDWLEVFTRKQMIILRSEDFYRNPKMVVNDVFRFFGLAAMDKVRRGGRNERRPTDFVPYNRTLDMLHDFFHSYNEQLAEYLRSDKFLWKSSVF